MNELNSLGFAAKPLSYDFRDAANSSRWIGQLPNGDWVVGLFNRESTPQTRSIDFRRELGIEDGREMKLSVNDILFPPAWWTANEGELGFYHPKKWRKLIELDPIFAIEDAFVGTGVDMTKKSQILREWLNKNIIIDDETGMRIMMDGLVEITDLN